MKLAPLHRQRQRRFGKTLGLGPLGFLERQSHVDDLLRLGLQQTEPGFGFLSQILARQRRQE
ncbi:MAG: hypothetical protein WCE38_01030 [Burkholderiales bacterium]